MARVTARGNRIISPGATGRTSPIGFLQEVYGELRKSVWPSREEVTRLTVVVICLAVAAGFFLGLLDRLFAETFTRYVLWPKRVGLTISGIAWRRNSGQIILRPERIRVVGAPLLCWGRDRHDYK